MSYGTSRVGQQEITCYACGKKDYIDKRGTGKIMQAARGTRNRYLCWECHIKRIEGKDADATGRGKDGRDE